MGKDQGLVPPGAYGTPVAPLVLASVIAVVGGRPDFYGFPGGNDFLGGGVCPHGSVSLEQKVAQKPHHHHGGLYRSNPVLQSVSRQRNRVRQFCRLRSSYPL